MKLTLSVLLLMICHSVYLLKTVICQRDRYCLRIEDFEIDLGIIKHFGS